MVARDFIFELWASKAETKGVIDRSSAAMVTFLNHENEALVFSNNYSFFSCSDAWKRTFHSCSLHM